MTAYQSTRTVKSEQLYRLFDADGTLLYIGISYSAIARFAQHKADKPWIGDVCRIEIETHDVSRAEILEIERQAIISERPLHNVVHSGAKTPADVPDGVAEFFAAELCIGPHLHEVAVAMDALINAHQKLGYAISQKDFNHMMAAVAGSLRLGDRCPQCSELNYPVGVERDSARWVTARYICNGCWYHRWTCGWAA
jgi:predicted GIY-YIG superfamily endonuclease